jgi:hypothetical protein
MGAAERHPALSVRPRQQNWCIQAQHERKSMMKVGRFFVAVALFGMLNCLGGEAAYNFRSKKVSGEGLGFFGHETASAKFGAFGGGLLASSDGQVGAYGHVGPGGGGG